MFKTQMYGTDFWTLWERARVGCFKRTALKHVYYQGWNRSPAQVGCMRQVLKPGALGKPRGSGWRGRWGTHVNPWLNHFNVWQNPLQYCRVIGLQLIRKKKKLNGKTKQKMSTVLFVCFVVYLLDWVGGQVDKKFGIVSTHIVSFFSYRGLKIEEKVIIWWDLIFLLACQHLINDQFFNMFNVFSINSIFNTMIYIDLKY